MFYIGAERARRASTTLPEGKGNRQAEKILSLLLYALTPAGVLRDREHLVADNSPAAFDFVEDAMQGSCRRRSSLLAVVLLVLLEAAAGASQDSPLHAAAPGDESSPAMSLPRADDGSVADNDLEFYKRLYDFGLGKRAYSYVSEYKRLPVYNFGLGKRSRTYSFGLGKRPADYEDYYAEGDEDAGQEDDDAQEELDSNSIDKRARQYSFGLGKRTKPYSFGLGKRTSSGQQSLYSFGLGKKAERPHSMYSFGLGKRADGRLYAFGLGKRPSDEARRPGSRSSFGLGKRVRPDDEEEEDAVDEGKRSQHRFSFGLGKREVSPKELEAVKKEEEEQKKPSPQAKEEVHQISKRSLRYPFVVGKRGEMDWDADDVFDDGNRIPSYARLSRRPYNFGLGKRIPMYDFGLGKRSESE